MIILIDTSTPECRLSFVEQDWRYDTVWEAGRGLARGLLSFLNTQLETQGRTWGDVTGLVVFKGPGSFTGLRISSTVFNTLAYTNQLPIVGASGDTWQEDGVARLLAGQDDSVVLPEYGGEANITKPRK